MKAHIQAESVDVSSSDLEENDWASAEWINMGTRSWSNTLQTAFEPDEPF